MKSHIIVLRSSDDDNGQYPSKKINDYLQKIDGNYDNQSWFFEFETLHNCQVTITNYIDDFCQTNNQIQLNRQYQLKSNTNTFNLKVNHNVSYMILSVPKQRLLKDRHQMLVFYCLPEHVLNVPNSIDYHKWIWKPTRPGLILIPNLNNHSKYYLQVTLKPFQTIDEHQVKNSNLINQTGLWIHPNLHFRFYLDSHLPITIYNQQMTVILGETLGKPNLYLTQSVDLRLDDTYYISCNRVISGQTSSIIRILVGVYNQAQLIYSDYLILRIAPTLLIPNSQNAKIVYLAKMGGNHENSQFIADTQQILTQEGLKSVVISHDKISMYHRWTQDILKFTYQTNEKHTQYLLLKGPHFQTPSRKGHDVSYIFDYFTNYPKYDFAYERDNNLDAFGNVQILPPILPNYPLGRIIYGISNTPNQSNISYNLVDFLESQQIQKPIHVNTGWLNVGHVDEILSYIPDPKHRLGFRILIASTHKFIELISKLDPLTIIFNNSDNYYVFHEPTTEITHKFKQRNHNQTEPCRYQSQLSVKEILNWTELIETNQTYQTYLDEIKQILIHELNLQVNDIYEIPIYYWPKSISKRAKSIMPNMINNLYLNTPKSQNQHRGIILVPKPFLNNLKTIPFCCDLFEMDFIKNIPKDIKVYFVNNWDSYYLLDGDINCGTNVLRTPIKTKWWSQPPIGTYNIE